MFHEDIPIVNISKLNYWLVICIAKNLIWTTLKMIFSIFRFFLHPQIPDFQILSKPYINVKIISSPACVAACVCKRPRSCPTGCRTSSGCWGSGPGSGTGSGEGCWSFGFGRSGRREPRADPRARRRNRRGVPWGNVLERVCPSRHRCSGDSPWSGRTAYQALRGTTDQTELNETKRASWLHENFRSMPFINTEIWAQTQCWEGYFGNATGYRLQVTWSKIYFSYFIKVM